MYEGKVKSLDELSYILEGLKREGKRIVQCHGVFDIIHYGHVQHFLAAKTQGDVLVITLTPDRFVNKGPGRPLFNEEIRAKHIANVACVDYVAVNRWPGAVDTIKLLKPDVYCKGKEVLANAGVDVDSDNKKISALSAEEEAVNSVGGRLYLTDEVTFSSSKIINQIATLVPDEAKVYLKELRENVSPGDVNNALDSLRGVRVLVMGDAILDEYTYCNELGKAGKEALIVYNNVNSEIHMGGVFAVAHHLRGFTKNVGVLTCVGDDNLDFVNENIDESIQKHVIVKKDSKTLKKRRYIDQYKRLKLFEIYNIEKLSLGSEIEDKVINFLAENLDRYDMVLVTDFGHGMMTPKVVEYLCSRDKFLAVNTQINGGNLGYNFITKYSRANFVSLNDKELRLSLQERESDIKEAIAKLSRGLNIDSVNITLGKSGSMYYRGGGYYPAPAFTKDPRDTIGSGDAVLALTSLLTYKRANPRIVSFVANCTGALAVNIVGNRKAVDPVELRKFINYIMK